MRREAFVPIPSVREASSFAKGGLRTLQWLAKKGEYALAMKNREEIAHALAGSGYIADGELATAISLMQMLRRPLLLEGEAGVGKTEVAKALAGCMRPN